MIKLKILWWGECHGLSKWVQWNPKSPYERGNGGLSQRRRWSNGNAEIRVRWGLETGNAGSLKKLKRDRNGFSSKEKRKNPEGMQPCQLILYFWPWEYICVALRNYMVICYSSHRNRIHRSLSTCVHLGPKSFLEEFYGKELMEFGNISVRLLPNVFQSYFSKFTSWVANSTPFQFSPSNPLAAARNTYLIPQSRSCSSV